MGIYIIRKIRGTEEQYEVKCKYKDSLFSSCKTYLWGKRQALDLRNTLNKEWSSKWKFSDVAKYFMNDDEIKDFIEDNKDNNDPGKILYNDYIVDLNNNPIII